MSVSPTHFAELGIAVKASGSAEQRPPCPQCGKTGPFAVNVDSGLFHCFVCQYKGRASDSHSVDRIQPIRKDDSADQEKRREKIRKRWRETVHLYHRFAKPVREYLEFRGLGEILKDPPLTLRAHPGCQYWDEKLQMIGTYPALIALFHSKTGAPVTVHTTYIRHDGAGKANVPNPKKVMSVPVRGSTKYGAIRLYEPRDGVLGIAEGIESALSLSVLHKIPVWASSCAGNLPHVFLPKRLRELHIGIDLDHTGVGLASAQLLADRVTRWNGSPKVILRYPDLAPPADLNDELRRLQGAE